MGTIVDKWPWNFAKLTISPRGSRRCRTKVDDRQALGAGCVGLMGDVKPVGEGLSELRIDFGPGYRLYLKQQGKTLIVLLCGGDKSTQKQDIRRAKKLSAGL